MELDKNQINDNDGEEQHEIYIRLMNNKILNFNPQFQYSKEKNEFVLKNVDDKHDWLISLLPKQKCRNVYIVPPKKNNAGKNMIKQDI